MGEHIVNVSAVQTTPASMSKDENVAVLLRLLQEAAGAGADLVVFPELATTPYFPTGGNDAGVCDWAEHIPGPTTSAFGEVACRFGLTVVLPLFEKGDLEGEYFNSAVVIGPDGRIVPGVLPDGQSVNCYRKNHLALVDYKGFRLNEALYMRLGGGYPVFASPQAVLGVLICYDRWFPEAWRSLALGGAEMVLVPAASCYGASGGGGDIFTWSMRTWAHQNLLFAVGANKAGVEHVERDIEYYGLSCIIHPSGEILALGREAMSPEIVTAECNLADVAAIRKGMPYFRDRRQDIDGFMTGPVKERHLRPALLGDRGYRTDSPHALPVRER